MQFTSIITTSLLAVMAVAAPAPEPIEARAVALLDAWQSANYAGVKYAGVANPGACVNLPAAYNNYLSSAKAKPGYTCAMYAAAGCTGSYLTVTAAGTPVMPAWIDNAASSWKCA